MIIDGETIDKYLKSIGIESNFLRLSENVPIDTVLVPLMMDQGGKKIILQIMLTDKKAIPVDSSQTASEFLQFFLGFPYLVPQDLILPMVRLLNLLNRTCELGAFGVVEEEPYPFFRYTYIHKGQMSQEVLLSLIGSIALIVEKNIDAIADLANQTRTFKEISEDSL